MCSHTFFGTVDWDRLYADPPVFRPELESGGEDTSYFEGKLAHGLAFPDGFEARLQAELAAPTLGSHPPPHI